jgi:adenosine deaminase
MQRVRIALSLFAGTALYCASAQTRATHALTPGEARASQALDAAAKMGPGELYAFLKPFPKGGDLHMHLSGAVYAETFIAEAAREGLCVASVDRGTPPTPKGQDAVRFVAPEHNQLNDCGGAGEVTAASALHNQPLYDDLVDSFSMRAFVPTEGIDGHDQFFATFERFSGLKSDAGEWLDEVATRAAAQNEQYLEIMQTPAFSHAAALGNKIGWPADFDGVRHLDVLARLRDQLLAAGLRDEVSVDRQELADAEAIREKREACNSPLARTPDAMLARSTACSVKIHWLYQILRGYPPQQVFAQTLLGFEVASADPDVVGINFVMPEDGRISMQDYYIQMQMLDYLHSVYPRVHISLHAGELAPGMVPPEGLSFHIRQAIDLGHAQRIGHGIDVLYEDRPAALLKEMADKHVMVEINLTSNAGILGIAGKAHPLHAYMAAHVPWALSTDDEGVSRIDLTHEYVRGVEEQGLTYPDLKQSARASLEHSFIPGADLWASPDDFTHRVSACAAAIAAESKPGPACAALLKANERAAEQWELERRFAVFEDAQKK